nr:TATA element modulatory factor isoform X2 [Halyomorpha halys]
MTMSWFDASGFANLAKSALKEAQKTIDKALDITEEDASKAHNVSSTRNPDINTDSFFSAWDLQSSPASLVKKATKMTNSASAWGSFTGSFFENQGKAGGSSDDSKDSLSKELVSNQPKKSLSLDLGVLAKPNLADSSEKVETPSNLQSTPEESNEPDGEQIRQEIKNFPPVEVIMRKREPRNTANRLSVISSESDRRSTDSCDILGSTPDSDPNTMSTSSSVAKLRQSGSFESVEVLTSPSSVDVLGSHSSEQKSSDSVSPIEGDGVEVIPEDEDSVSVEDSYTSASEATLTVTLLDPTMLKSTSSLDTSFTEAMSPRDNQNRTLGVITHMTSAPVDGEAEKKEPIITQPSRLVDKKEVHSKSVEYGTSLQARMDYQEVVTQAPRLSVGRISESTSSETDGVVLETSSCEEGTLMGSSGEENTLRLEGVGVSSMLAEAMTEVREQSPISSERSDLVKIGSSEHTSGDELETTTSSDIEVISSPTPNGSSTASRQSPSKSAYKSVNIVKILSGKVKGHHRELSETSSGGSDEYSEVDKLLKRIAEMTEILEARESKLIDLSRINADLQEINCELKSQLEKEKESQEMKNMSEEFTQRLAALEKKFQQAIREKEALKKQVDQAKSLAAEKEEELNKDQLIEELRSEGEKLSKQQLTLNNAIKKLRASEKENIKTISNLREQLNSTNQELERNKKAISAKEEMERMHIEAVHNLTKQNQQLEKELSLTKSNLSTLTSTLVSAQKEIKEKEEAYKALQEKVKTEQDEVEQNLRRELSTELEATQQQVITLQSALEDMRRQMIEMQEQHSRAEMTHRRERSELLSRAEAAERRAEAEAETATLATAPLARQVQVLTELQVSARASWEAREAQLNSLIAELETRISSLSLRERSVREEYEASASLIASLQDKSSSLSQQNETLLKELDSMKGSMEKLRVLKNSEMKKFQQEKERLMNDLEAKKRETTSLKELLSIERAALDAEKRKCLALQEQLRNSRMQSSPQVGTSPRSSPTLSLGRSSISESFAGNIWSNFADDLLETSSNSGRYDVLRPANNTSYIENLQAQLKLRDGDIQQLQWEIARLDSEKTNLRDEVSSLTAKLEKQSADLSSFSLLKTQYDALLQMYGEKLEESQELRMDLQDVKEMYKAQIDELLSKKEASPPAS